MTLRILKLPSSPKGEIVGIMILVWLHSTGVVPDGNSFKWKNTGVVLDGNSFKWQNSDQALKMMKDKRSTGA